MGSVICLIMAPQRPDKPGSRPHLPGESVIVVLAGVVPLDGVLRQSEVHQLLVDAALHGAVALLHPPHQVNMDHAVHHLRNNVTRGGVNYSNTV